MRGVVVQFDDHAGVGTIRGDDGRELFFHCTAISDGTRTIDAGSAVEFDVRAGHLGQWEAEAVRPSQDRP
ncbi:MAG: cold shock protein [Actinomycetota bacterium]|jgi:cold shock CspA family protein|nr:cold shock protein [Actinomycetota bacterium]